MIDETSAPSLAEQKEPGHVLKVELGEFTRYHLTCNLNSTHPCRQVCRTHPEGGCGDPDVEGTCYTIAYEHGCVIAEWVNDGGIESVGFDHTLELPIEYHWEAAHDSPILEVAASLAEGGEQKGIQELWAWLGKEVHNPNLDLAFPYNRGWQEACESVLTFLESLAAPSRAEPETETPKEICVACGLPVAVGDLHNECSDPDEKNFEVGDQVTFVHLPDALKTIHFTVRVVKGRAVQLDALFDMDEWYDFDEIEIASGRAEGTQ